MEFKVLTVYGKKDGYANGIYLARNSTSFMSEFVSHITLSNKENESKGRPTMKLDDFEIREIGTFDDEDTKLTNYEKGFKVIPMIIETD